MQCNFFLLKCVQRRQEAICRPLEIPPACTARFEHVLAGALPERAAKIINACAVLHNICINNNLPHVPPEPEDVNIDYGIFNQAELNIEARQINQPLYQLNQGRLKRNLIIRNHFH
jgi:hypothetical protein